VARDGLDSQREADSSGRRQRRGSGACCDYSSSGFVGPISAIWIGIVVNFLFHRVWFETENSVTMIPWTLSACMA